MLHKVSVYVQCLFNEVFLDTQYILFSRVMYKRVNKEVPTSDFGFPISRPNAI